MTPDQARRLVGSVFAVRFPQSWDELDLERFPVSKFIVFRDVLGPTIESSRRRLHDASTVLAEHGLGLPTLMIDEEGGRVTQTVDFFQSAPSALAVARSLTPEEAGTLYLHLAAYLADLGIGISLGPCVDVNTEPLNPIIGTRAFGSNPDTVSLYGREAVAAMKKRVMCVAKHFPGHGMTRLDSHLALPVVEESRSQLEAIHLAPFREAIRAHVDGIMVSHCRYTSLQQDGLPASLSRAVVTDCLRRQMGFSGAVITDSLDMRAVTETLPPEDAARLALEAGCDLLLYTEISDRFRAAFDYIVDLAASGAFGEERFTQSADRMMMPLFRGRLRSLTQEAGVRLRDAEMGEAAPAEGSPRRHQADDGEFATRIYLDLLYRARAGSIRVMKGRDRLPVSLDRADVVSTSRAVPGKLRPHIASLADRSAGASQAGGDPLILWLTEPLFLSRPLDSLKDLARRAPVAILVTTYKQLADEFEDADVVILADDTSPHAEDSIVRWLFEKPPRGDAG